MFTSIYIGARKGRSVASSLWQTAREILIFLKRASRLMGKALVHYMNMWSVPYMVPISTADKQGMSVNTQVLPGCGESCTSEKQSLNLILQYLVLTLPAEFSPRLEHSQLGCNRQLPSLPFLCPCLILLFITSHCTEKTRRDDYRKVTNTPLSSS